jgi:hypothetical protein
MSRAGLGLGLHDVIYGTDFGTQFDAWWDHARRHYFSMREGAVVGPVTHYYDPLIPVHHVNESMAAMKLLPAMGALPLKREDCRALYDVAMDQLGWRGTEPIEPGVGDFAVLQLLGSAFMARELGEDDLYARLQAHAEDNHEPTWDAETGEFTWGFGLGEEHPRGQLNATAALVEVTSPDSWWGLINQPNLRKFVEPTVHGVDFPKVCLSQAVYDVERRILAVATDAGAPGAAGEPTTFLVSNVAPEACVVEVDGVRSSDWRVAGDELEISTAVGKHTFVIRCN